MLARTGIGAALFLSAACASSGTIRPSTGSVAKWTGSFRSANSASSATLAPVTPNRGTGNIAVTAMGGTPAQSRVELMVNVPTGGQDQVAWGIFNGGCGSPGPSIIGQDQFTPISISSTGDGHLKTDLTFALDAKSSYHANIYWTARANDMNDIMMCANLQPGG